MAKTTKVVKVPVVVADEDKSLRLLKYRALGKVMEEARSLGNVAIRYAIAFSLKGIPAEKDPETGKDVPLDTRISRILNTERKYLLSDTASSLGRNFAVKAFRNANKAAWAGQKSLPTYRSAFIPFRNRDTKIYEVDHNGSKQFIIEPAGFAGKWLPDELIEELVGNNNIEISTDQKKLKLVSYFSWKDGGAREVVNRIISGEYKLRDSIIQRDKKGLMLFLSYQFEPDQPALDPKKVCGVDLGVITPAVCALNTGPQRRYIGSGEDVWAARSKFRALRRREQRRKGLYSKTRAWTPSKKETQWIQTYYHALTRQVIKFCLQHDCGTIHVEDLASLRQEDVKSEYRRLLWIPSKFLDLLSYKAKEAGIEIVMINPRNTSRRCSECGHISKGNRKKQKVFICEACGDPQKPVHADYNAARNIALAEGDVIKEGYIDKESDLSDQDGLILEDAGEA
jgi:IS605 OrfB family transposase